MIDRKSQQLLTFLLVALVTAALLAACTSPGGGGAEPTAVSGGGGGGVQTPPTSTPSTQSNITNYTSLNAALRDRGLSPFPAGSANVAFMSIAGIKAKVGSEFLFVFEYREDASATADAEKIQPDGTVAGDTTVWKAVPHFYRSNRVIVIYDGTDATLLQTLSEVMGPPFAEGQ